MEDRFLLLLMNIKSIQRNACNVSGIGRILDLGEGRAK